MSQEPTFFVDAMTGATVRSGVARLSFSTQRGDGTASHSLTLALPVQQVPILADALVRVLRELEARAKEARDAAPDVAPSPPVTSGFRFEG